MNHATRTVTVLVAAACVATGMHAQLQPCRDRLDEISTSLSADRRDLLSLVTTLASVTEGDAALSLQSTAEKASLVLDGVADNLMLRDVIRCTSDRKRVDEQLSRILVHAADFLRRYADETVLDTGHAANVTLTTLSSRIRDRLRDAASLVDACVPHAP